MTGNCIGERNHGYFVLFLTAVSLLTVVTTLSSLAVVAAYYHRALQQLHNSGPSESLLDHVVSEYPSTEKYGAPVRQWEDAAHLLWTVMRELPVTVIFGLFTALCAWSLVSLLLYHVRIISIAQTTNERVRGVYLNHAENPLDRGCVNNWRRCCTHSLCTPIPSRLPRDFSEFVVEDPATMVEESPWNNGGGGDQMSTSRSLASFRSEGLSP
jgi:hypothetical protein